MIAVGTTSLLFYHQQAFLNSNNVIEEIRSKYQGNSFYALEVSNDEVSLEAAIQTYLFNTQLIDCSNHEADSDKQFLLIAPTECAENNQVKAYLDSVIASAAPITEVRYFDLRESMKNGGGPACLRLRVALSQDQIDSIEPRVMLDKLLYDDLVAWVNAHYRDRLTFEDLRDPKLLDELKTAASALESILGLEGVYQLD